MAQRRYGRQSNQQFRGRSIFDGSIIAGGAEFSTGSFAQAGLRHHFVDAPVDADLDVSGLPGGAFALSGANTANRFIRFGLPRERGRTFRFYLSSNLANPGGWEFQTNRTGAAQWNLLNGLVMRNTNTVQRVFLIGRRYVKLDATSSANTAATDNPRAGDWLEFVDLGPGSVWVVSGLCTGTVAASVTSGT